MTVKKRENNLICKVQGDKELKSIHLSFSPPHFIFKNPVFTSYLFYTIKDLAEAFHLAQSSYNNNKNTTTTYILVTVVFNTS